MQAAVGALVTRLLIGMINSIKRWRQIASQSQWASAASQPDVRRCHRQLRTPCDLFLYGAAAAPRLQGDKRRGDNQVQWDTPTVRRDTPMRSAQPAVALMLCSAAAAARVTMITMMMMKLHVCLCAAPMYSCELQAPIVTVSFVALLIGIRPIRNSTTPESYGQFTPTKPTRLNCEQAVQSCSKLIIQKHLHHTDFETNAKVKMFINFSGWTCMLFSIWIISSVFLRCCQISFYSNFKYHNLTAWINLHFWGLTKVP